MEMKEYSPYQQAFETSIDAIVCADEAGLVTLWNPAAEKMFGYSHKEIVGQPISVLMPINYRAKHDAGFEKFLETGQVNFLGKSVELFGLQKNGEEFPVELRISASNYFGWSFTAGIRDISERKKAEKELTLLYNKFEELSYLDGLTKISNRRKFDATLDKEWKRAQRNDATLSLIMVDIDYFKLYNDHYGHLQGDECLKIVAKAVDSSFNRVSDLVSRYGGEEFAILLPETDSKAAILGAERCLSSVSKQKITHEHTKVPGLDAVSVSIGVASTSPSLDDQPLELVGAADQMLYKAKHNGRNRAEHS
jgi:diguanylate cyclase (GGDEF)-like protein/PAS domain S-box-containing protein